MKACLTAAMVVCIGCAQSGIDEPAQLVDLDENFFRCEVQPVLAARCSFMDCHGSDVRPFRVYAEQRFRLGVTWDEFETPLLAEELSANFDVARGFVDRSSRRDHLLSEKPLDVSAGGQFHRGKDLYGTDDVFLSADDVGYQVLRRFAANETADSDCVLREEVGF